MSGEKLLRNLSIKKLEELKEQLDKVTIRPTEIRKIIERVDKLIEDDKKAKDFIRRIRAEGGLK